MSSRLKSRSFRFDRRQFLKHTGVMGVGATFLSRGLPAFGQETTEDDCRVVDTQLSVDGLELLSAERMQYFVDGLHFNDRSNIPSRANIAFFIQEQQLAERYVERVVLTDAIGNTLGVQYFEADDRTSQGLVPYVIFENIQLTFDQVYNIFYQVRMGTDIELHHAQLQNAKRSLLNSSSLPETVLNDFAAYRGENNGLITTAYELYTGDAGLHSARGYIRDISSDNSFQIDIELMHGDIDAGHFMRYFIVADPVGRLLGMKKRNLNDPIDTTSPAGANAMSINPMSDAEAQALNITPADVAKINDCPYVQIYTEDVFDALARSTIRLI
jgi:hypothetical protein